jgi:anti-sigma regulatory factor (Ser/Thr protein kinase)
VANAVQISLDPSPQAPRTARAVLQAAYAESIPAILLDDLKVVVTELVANSYRHAPNGPIRLRVEQDGEMVLNGAVEDAGRARFGMVDIRDSGGLGLHIVDALAKDWKVADAGGRVRFTVAD